MIQIKVLRDGSRALRLCDGSEDIEVDHLHEWLGDVEWEGHGHGITVVQPDLENVEIYAGQWVVRSPAGVISCKKTL